MAVLGTSKVTASAVCCAALNTMDSDPNVVRKTFLVSAGLDKLQAGRSLDEIALDDDLSIERWQMPEYGNLKVIMRIDGRVFTVELYTHYVIAPFYVWMSVEVLKMADELAYIQAVKPEFKFKAAIVAKNFTYVCRFAKEEQLVIVTVPVANQWDLTYTDFKQAAGLNMPFRAQHIESRYNFGIEMRTGCCTEILFKNEHAIRKARGILIRGFFIGDVMATSYGGVLCVEKISPVRGFSDVWHPCAIDVDLEGSFLMAVVEPNNVKIMTPYDQVKHDDSTITIFWLTWA